jgi:hypothetical protein
MGKLKKNCRRFCSTRFFGEKDKTSSQFIISATNDSTIPRISASPSEQPGFFQSVIYPDSYGIQLTPTNILLSGTESSNVINQERKDDTTSTTSFHSVKSATPLSTTSALVLLKIMKYCFQFLVCNNLLVDGLHKIDY